MTDRLNHHSIEECREAVEKLAKNQSSISKKSRAAYFLSRNTNREADDLIQEAADQICNGTRKWPLDVSFDSFFYNVIRSISYNWYVKEKSKKEDNDDYALLSGITSQKTSFIEMKELYEEVIESFGDDENAKRIFIAAIEGLEGEELRKECGLDATQYANRRRFVRRRIEAYLKRDKHG